jgi:hypothetical protein
MKEEDYIKLGFHPEFKPELTPRMMLELGVFDGWYFQGDYDEFPVEWFSTARLGESGPDINCNYFQVHASQPLVVWQQKGWIHPMDPRGWFQWYCRYYLGRRLPEEDMRQIKRWKAFARHKEQVKKYCQPGDQLCRRRQRQALLHWAYDGRSL